ncbi:uncharacterized protein LOC128215023 [Mya arenaria]|uniref:uncharacterized protein LOC128215023 n=1 Tax=Mya arenaria TaxID=6604 RepID=UPI0022E47B73|nr:uncharacterized protein LOC128215023 [Mya arenaria]
MDTTNDCFHGLFFVCCVFLCWSHVSCDPPDWTNDGLGDGHSGLQWQLDDDNPLTWTHSRTMSAYFMKFIIGKGCVYSAAFVRSHYTLRYQHASRKRNVAPSSCDWIGWSEKSCHDYHVPEELCCAVIDCGAAHSAIAFDRNETMTNRCNLTNQLQNLHMGSASLAMGKRQETIDKPDQQPFTLYRPPPSVMCAAEPSALIGRRNSHDDELNFKLSTLLTVLGIRNDINTSPTTTVSTIHTQFTTSVRPVTSSDDKHTGGHTLPLSVKVERWCKQFSKMIKRKYHFGQSTFVRHSLYWIEDVYATSRRHHVPKPYAHGLIGCGMKYAMRALNANNHQTSLYRAGLR